MVSRDLWCESQFAREVHEVVLLRRQENIIKLQGRHLCLIRLYVLWIVMAHIRRTGTHSAPPRVLDRRDAQAIALLVT